MKAMPFWNVRNGLTTLNGHEGKTASVVNARSNATLSLIDGNI